LSLRRTLKLLVTRLGQEAYALDAAEVESLEAMGAPAGTPHAAVWLHDLLGYSGAPAYRMPLLAKRRGHSEAIVLDGMDEILEVDLAALRPLPPLVERHALRRGLWSVLPRAGDLLFLLDLGTFRKPMSNPAMKEEP
jgi:hypothetical protein